MGSYVSWGDLSGLNFHGHWWWDLHEQAFLLFVASPVRDDFTMAQQTQQAVLIAGSVVRAVALQKERLNPQALCSSLVWECSRDR